MSKLKIDDVVSVVVATSGPVTPRDAFDTGLIIGSSNHITTTARYKIYSDLDGMVDDGFLATDPEYKAAQLYFSQNPKPQKVVVGRRDATLTEGVPAETWVQAITACKQATGAWYAVYVADANLTASDHAAIAAYVQTIRAVYFYDSHAAGDIDGTATTDTFSVLKAASYGRSIGLYTGTAFGGAALMGFAMGANDGTPGSAYTLFGKSLTGVTTDDLTETQVAVLKAKNANYYVNRGNSYNLVEHGVMADGVWFDEVIGLDQLANDLQISCMDVITKTKTKVPYTDAGAMQFIVACNEACYNAAQRGFIGPGIWTKDSVLELEKGDMLETGYRCQAELVANQPSANRGLRISPPVYVCVILTGAIQSVVIKVIVE